MNKCPKCGTEFEGKFCPNCGEKFEEKKTCPKCGAKLPASARFCNECGYAFFEQSEKKVNKPQTDNKQQLYFALKFVPLVAFALFSVLLFIIYATPVVEIVMGMGLPNESFGNVYAFSNFIEDIPQLKGAMLTLFVFLALSVIYSCIMCIAQFAKKFIYKDINIGEQKMLFNEFLGYTSFVFYAALLIIGISIISIISSADEGMGLLTFGACPILLIVFSIIFTLISVGAIIARYTLAKKHPEFKKEETKKRDQYFESENLRKEQFYATHTPPVEPVKPTTPDGQTNSPDNAEELAYRRAAVVYKHEKRRYENAIEKPTPAAVIWFDLHKEAIIWISILLTITIILTSVLVPILTNKFRVDVVKDIQLGYTQEQVSEILGEPNDISNDKKQWKYYSSEYKSILGKIKKNNKQQEKALEKGNESELLKLVNEEEKLNKQLENVTYNFIEIKFESDEQNEFAVSSVYLEKDRCDSFNNATTQKEVEKVELSTEEIGYYSDLTGGQVEEKLIGYDGQLYYTAYYKGGAFNRAYLKNETSQIDNKSEITIKWTDKFASYKMTYEAINIGVISADGSWIRSSSSRAKEFLENYYDNESNWQNDVLYLGDLLYDAKATLSGSYELKEGIKIIVGEAFSYCKSLTNITIPNSVISIGEKVFSGCTSLESISVDENNAKYSSQDGILYDKNKTQFIYIPIAIKNATIPNSITSINSSDFSGCASLESITVDENNAKYSSQDGILYNKDKTQFIYIPKAIKGNVTIPDSIITIGERAFYKCTSLKSITIPASVTSINYSSFQGCTSLESILVDENNAEYSSQSGILYDKDKTEIIRVPQTKTNITIPNSVTSIGDYAFEHCNSLTSIIIPDSVTVIGSCAFSDCTSLASVNIPDSVASISYQAFYNCTSLTKITIPDSVTSIGSTAFSNTAYYNNSGNWIDDVLYIGKYLIKAKNTLSENYTIRNDTKLIARGAFSGCTAEIKWGDNPSIKEIGGYAFSGYQGTSITIPNSVTTIGAYAFSGCNLTSITIPNSVTVIGMCAFGYCGSLASVTIPNSVTVIGSDAFLHCGSLTSVIIPDSVTVIGSCAFCGCDSLKSITIPDSVTSIGGYAFQDCTNLTSINIGNGVTSIGSYAFSGCTCLNSVTFENPNGWKVSEYSSMSNASNVTLGTPTENAKLLRSTYREYYWHRYDS